MSDEKQQGICELKPKCSKPAVLRYPAMGGGYMRLCAEHGAPHAKYCERWTSEGWATPPVTEP